MSRFFLILTVFLTLTVTTVLGQTNCDSLSPDLVQRFNNYSQKEIKKLYKKNDLDLLTTFHLATYLRQKADTTCRQWYNKFLDRSRVKCYPANPKMGQKILYLTGVAYFFLDDFIKADSYFQKAEKIQYADAFCVQYYHDLTKQKIK